MVGIYLHGSAVLGGLRERSDLDVITVVAKPLTTDEKERLASVLRGISKNPHSLDFDLLVQSEIRPWRYPPPFDFHYSEWGGTRTGGTNPDLASLITIVLAHGRPLLGPPPAEVFDPVPPEDFRRALIPYVDDVNHDLESDTRNAVLTLARIWHAMEAGDVFSKDAAAEWALARLPAEHRSVLERAVEIYRGERDDFWDDLRPQIDAYANYAAGEISRAMRTAST